MISINFQNIVTIGLITFLASATVRFLESKTGVDLDMDGEVSDFDLPFTASTGKSNKRNKK